MTKTDKKYSSFGEEIGDISFHPELPKTDLKDVIGVPYLIKDAIIVEGFRGKFGISDFALLLIEDDNGNKTTTLCGGQVIVDKIRKALDKNLLPLYGTIVRQESGAGQEYYNIT